MCVCVRTRDKGFELLLAPSGDGRRICHHSPAADDREAARYDEPTDESEFWITVFDDDRSADVLFLILGPPVVADQAEGC